MREVILDGNDIFGTADIHELLAEKLSFPEYYGKNLDALHDCLTELSEEVCIRVANADVLQMRLGVAYERLCRVIRDAAKENGCIRFSE